MAKDKIGTKKNSYLLAPVMFVKIPLLNFAYLMLALESLLFQLCLILSAKVVDPLSGRKSKDEGGVSVVEVPPNVGPTIKASAASQMESAMAALSVELSKLRTGRASTGMIDHIIVETGGVKMHLNRFSLVSVLD